MELPTTKVEAKNGRPVLGSELFGGHRRCCSSRHLDLRERGHVVLLSRTLCPPSRGGGACAAGRRRLSIKQGTQSGDAGWNTHRKTTQGSTQNWQAANDEYAPGLELYDGRELKYGLYKHSMVATRMYSNDLPNALCCRLARRGRTSA